MSRILGYLTDAVQGLERYFVASKLIVLLFAILLAGWLTAKKAAGAKSNRMLIYTLIMCVLLICPLTAVAVMIYQTGFYDYEWAWSLVPITAVIAYGAAFLVDKYFKKTKAIWGVLLVAGVLFLCGNQGSLQVVSTLEAEAKVDVQELLQCINDKGKITQKILWAPKNIMQEVRRQDGRILLIYGRDMWDEKAGAYDYEAYNESVTNAYIWLENIVELERQLNGIDGAAEIFITLCEEQELDEALESNLWIMMEAGVNTVVLPKRTADFMEESLQSVASQRGVMLDIAYTEEYTIYFWE